MASRSEQGPMVSIGPELKKLLKIAYRARRPVLLEGSTGIGKSEILSQVASELGIGFVVLDLSLLEPPDLVGLPIMEAGRTSYAVPEILPTEGAGILLLEELNRAERYIQQPALQLLTARRLHQYELPEGWATCAAINPEKGEYQVTPMDPALRSRFNNLNVKADRTNWLEWAQSQDIHSAIVQLARERDDFLETVPPRTWKYVSDVLQVVTPEEFEQPTLIRQLLGGYLPSAWVTTLMTELKQNGARLGLEVRDIFSSYDTDQKLQQTVRGFIEAGQTDRLDAITRVAGTLIGGPEFDRLVSRNEFSLNAFDTFLADLPGDQREKLQEKFVVAPKAGLLLELSAADVLPGYKSGTATYRKVDKWIKKNEMHHRVRCLVQLVEKHLEDPQALPKLRTSHSHMAALGRFMKHLGNRWARPLRATCDKHQLDPVTK